MAAIHVETRKRKSLLITCNTVYYTTKCTALNDGSLWHVLNELYDVRSKWKVIGLGLRVPPSDLEAMSGDPLDCLQSSLTKWLKGTDPPPTWKALVAVLRSPVVGEEKKAQELEEKFCIITPPPSDIPLPTPSMSICALYIICV